MTYRKAWFTGEITLFTQELFEVPDALRQKPDELGYQIEERCVGEG